MFLFTCRKCNHALGSVNESIELLNKIINYIVKYNSERDLKLVLGGITDDGHSE